MGRVLVIGSSNTDLVVQTPHLPGPGETVIGGDLVEFAGGKGANQAVAAARAGGEVTFVAAVGADDFGDRALLNYQEEGIDTAFICRIEDAPTGMALIVVDEQGENQIAVAPGANEHLTPAGIDAADAAIRQAEIVLLQLEIPVDTVAAAIARARAYGRRIVLNPAPAKLLPAELLAQVDVLTPNRSEAAALAGVEVIGNADVEQAALLLLEQGVRNVIVTMGADGAFVATTSFQSWIEGFSVQAVDTTGAGDVFNGALAVALADGADVREAVLFANAAAALSVTRPGAQAAAPRREEILLLKLNRPAGSRRPGGSI